MMEKKKIQHLPVFWLGLAVLAGMALFFVFAGGKDAQAEETAQAQPPLVSNSIKIVSWDIDDFGKSKNTDQINVMAQQIKDADVVTLQSVMYGKDGGETLKKLVEYLKFTGATWQYALSGIPSGSGVERYAFLWKYDKVKSLQEPMLESALALDIDKEPFVGQFSWSGGQFTLVSVHLAEPNKNPAKEAAALRQIKNLHTTSPVLVVGNFNLENEDGAMQAWMNDGFEDAAMGKKTTLRITPDASGKRLDKGLDHFLLKSEQWEVHDSGTLDFSSQFLNLNTARMISGHIPVWASLSLR